MLFVQIQYLAQEFSAERLGKAMAIARRVMTNAIAKLGPGAETARAGLTCDAVAEASRGLFDEDWVAALKAPLPQGGFEKPSILRTSRASRGQAKTSSAPSGWAAGGGSGGRPQWITIGAAALLGGAVAFVAIQSGLIGTGNSPASNPPAGASEAVEQSAKAEAENRRKAEAEAAAAEVRKKAETEAAAAEVSRKAEAEAGAAKARKKAEAEAAAAEARRKLEAEAAAAEARRTLEAAAAAAEARRTLEAAAAAAEARRKLEAEAAAAEVRRKLEAEVAAAEARGKAEAEAAAAEERKKAEAAAAEAHRKAEAAAAEARRRKKAEAEAVEAGRRRRAEAEEAERRRRAAAEAPVRHSGGSSPIMHGIGN